MPRRTANASKPARRRGIPTPTDAGAVLRDELLAWFDVAKRDLPWRADRDPYRVWLSESMLQQTRVETVIPYFARFLERFPTVDALARAPIDDVLAAWSGLGYYRRARALHEAARAIRDRHAGSFPRTRQEWLDLPGVGPYTAGAVASIAFDAREALVDGNVERVFARLFELEDPAKSPALRRASWSAAEHLVRDARRPGDWNQALMELGATVCTPREPDCERCPVRAHCRAFAAGRTRELPVPAARRAAVDVELVVLIVRERGRVLLEQRPSEGRMASMWQLPTLQTSGEARLAPHEWAGRLRIAEVEPLGELRHSITHHRIRARVAVGRIVSGAVAAPFAWFEPSSVAALARTGMTRKIEARGWLHDSPPPSRLPEGSTPKSRPRRALQR